MAPKLYLKRVTGKPQPLSTKPKPETLLNPKPQRFGTSGGLVLRGDDQCPGAKARDSELTFAWLRVFKVLGVLGLFRDV